MSGKLVVIAFEGQHTAAGLLDNLKELQENGALDLEDAVVVSRSAYSEQLVLNPGGGMMGPPTTVSSSSIEVTQTEDRRGRAAAKWGGVGLLAGWLVGGPVGGLAVGALIGGLRDKGVDNKLVDAIAKQLHSDSSALFLLVKSGDPQRVLEEVRPFKGRVLQSTLSPETEQSLREALKYEE